MADKVGYGKRPKPKHERPSRHSHSLRKQNGNTRHALL